MGIKYLNYYDLFERFSIMTVCGGLSDEDALDYLKNLTTKELLEKLKKEVKND